MWSELVRTPSRMDAMLWPRLLALAERAWHRADWETLEEGSPRTQKRRDDWILFANTVGHKELRRLEAEGIEYYIHRPGARLDTAIT